LAEKSPLVEAQEKFVDAIPKATTAAQPCALLGANGRTLAKSLVADMDMPPYPRAIVEGFLVNAADTKGASEDNPISFKVVGDVNPGDETCPAIGQGEAIQVATGSIVSDDPVAVVRMWEAKQQEKEFSISRPFPPRFFLEEKGADLKKGNQILEAGTLLKPWELGLLAGLGLDSVDVARAPTVALFSSGDEVISHTASLCPGMIRDGNAIMLSAAISTAGGIPHFLGIMRDDFDGFVEALRRALGDHDMVVISGGTAVGGRDFISDLLREVGSLIVDGVPMRSGRPLIMGISAGKPIVCVAGHPPEALRGFKLFGAAALNILLGRQLPLPEDS